MRRTCHISDFGLPCFPSHTCMQTTMYLAMNDGHGHLSISLHISHMGIRFVHGTSSIWYSVHVY
jgi:hypothetical protein